MKKAQFEKLLESGRQMKAIREGKLRPARTIVAGMVMGEQAIRESRVVSQRHAKPRLCRARPLSPTELKKLADLLVAAPPDQAKQLAAEITAGFYGKKRRARGGPVRTGNDLIAWVNSADGKSLGLAQRK